MSGLTLTYKSESASLPIPVDKLLPGVDASSLADLFDIDGQSGEKLTLRNCPPLDRLGTGMTEGELIVEGDVGRELGAHMRGGVIHVTGDAGDHVGLRMRRGTIIVDGCAGAAPGFRMVAGTMVIGRGPYDHPGLEMRRGTIVCLDTKHQVSENAAFACAGEYEQAAMPVLRLIAGRVRHPHWRLLTGDRFELNKGEVWQPVN